MNESIRAMKIRYNGFSLPHNQIVYYVPSKRNGNLLRVFSRRYTNFNIPWKPLQRQMNKYTY